MGRKGAGGRPPKLSKEVESTIVNWVAAGNYFDTACSLAGVSKSSGYAWVKAGRAQKRGRYREFLDALNRARAEAETRLLAHIDNQAAGEWRAAAWRLEHMFPNRYRDKKRMEVTGKGGTPLDGPRAVIYLPDNGRLPSDSSDDK
jgi:transposase